MLPKVASSFTGPSDLPLSALEQCLLLRPSILGHYRLQHSVGTPQYCQTISSGMATSQKSTAAGSSNAHLSTGPSVSASTSASPSQHAFSPRSAMGPSTSLPPSSSVGKSAMSASNGAPGSSSNQPSSACHQKGGRPELKRTPVLNSHVTSPAGSSTSGPSAGSSTSPSRSCSQSNDIHQLSLPGASHPPSHEGSHSVNSRQENPHYSSSAQQSSVPQMVRSDAPFPPANMSPIPTSTSTVPSASSQRPPAPGPATRPPPYGEMPPPQSTPRPSPIRAWLEERDREIMARSRRVSGRLRLFELRSTLRRRFPRAAESLDSSYEVETHGGRYNTQVRVRSPKSRTMRPSSLRIVYPPNAEGVVGVSDPDNGQFSTSSTLTSQLGLLSDVNDRN